MSINAATEQCRAWQQLHVGGSNKTSRRTRQVPHFLEFRCNALRQKLRLRRSVSADVGNAILPLRCVSMATPWRDSWKLSDGNDEDVTKLRRKGESPYPLSDANARRVIKERARWESQLRKNKGSAARGVPWIKRSPQQMQDYLADNKWQARWRRRYKRHVESAISAVQQLASVPADSVDISRVMQPWFGMLTFRDMCTVLKEQRGWRPARDFFQWMKTQVPFRPSVVVYTILLRIYGEAGKIDLAEELLREMDAEECELDDVAYSSMIQAYGQAEMHDEMLSTYVKMRESGWLPSATIFTTMIYHLYKATRLADCTILWQQLLEARLDPLYHTYTLIINCFRRLQQEDAALEVFKQMKKAGFAPDELLYNMAISMLCRLERHEEGLKTFEAMRAQGIVPNKYSYASMMNICGKAGDYSGAAALFSEMRESGCSPDEVIYSTVISIYGKAQLFVEAEKVFEELIEASLLSSDKTYVMMANLRLKAGNTTGALQLVNEMQSRGLPMSQNAWDTLLLCHVKQMDLSSARCTFQEMIDLGVANIVSYTNMVNLFGALHNDKEAENLYLRLKMGKLQPDIEFYGAMIKVFCTAGKLDSAEQMVHAMEEMGLVPNDIIKTVLAAAYGKAGRITDAEACFRTSRGDPAAVANMISIFDECGAKAKATALTNTLTRDFNSLDSKTLNYLTRRFAREGELQKAESAYAAMVERGHQPETKTLSVLIQLCTKKGLTAKGVKFFEESRQAGLPPSAALYQSAINMCSKAGQLDEAIKLYKEAESACCVNNVTASIMIKAYSKAGMFDELTSLVKSARSTGVSFDVVMFNTIMQAYLEAGKPSAAMELFTEMQDSGLKPSLQTYTTLIGVCSKAGRPIEAAKFFESLKSSGCGVDEMAYNQMMDCFLKAGRYSEATEAFKEMLAAGISPSEVTLNTLIKVYNKAGRASEAAEVFRTMEEQGCAADPVTYLLVISTFGRLGRVKEAESLLEKMEDQGWSPGCPHYTSVILAYGEANMVDDALRVVAKMQFRGIKADIVCQRVILKIYLRGGRFKDGISYFEQIKDESSSDEKIRNLSFALYRAARRPVEEAAVSRPLMEPA